MTALPAPDEPTDPRALLAGPGRGVALRDEGPGGAEPAILVLHGGGGPATVADLSAGLATTHRVLTPTHPGFGGTPRPAWLDGIERVADLYLALLRELDLRDVVVVGSSLGGWIACEMALRDTDRLRGFVLIDAVGIRVEGEPVADPAALSPADLGRLTFHDPTRMAAGGPPTPEQAAARAGNMAALLAFDRGRGMQDPKLVSRLSHVSLPALVVWGASDGVATPAYGRALADALPTARLVMVPAAGHLPQVEQPEQVQALIRDFVGNVPQRP